MIEEIKLLFFKEKKNFTEYADAMQIAYGVSIGMLICAIIASFYAISGMITEFFRGYTITDPPSAFSIALIILFCAIAIMILIFMPLAKDTDELGKTHGILNYHPEDTEFGGE